MIDNAIPIGIIFLIVLSLLDIMTYNKKKGFIPSVLTTLFLIVAFLFGSEYYSITINLGIFGALLALLFTDLDLWGGIADFKVFVACSMLLNSIPQLLNFGLITTILSVMVKGYVKWKVTKGKDEHIPFIPIITIAFVVAGVLGA